MTLPLISVVIPTYNRSLLVKETVQSVINQDLAKSLYEIIVIDDCSRDDTEKILQRMQLDNPNVRFFVNDVNLNRSRTRNKGVEMAKGGVVAFIDDDCLASKQWLQEIHHSFESSSEIVGVEGKTVRVADQESPMTHAVENLSGGSYFSCNIAYRREQFLQLKGFDARYHGYGNEDIDLGFRMLSLGSIVFNENALVTHPPRPVLFWPKLKGIFYYTRNEIWNEYLLFYRFPQEYRKVKYHTRVSGTIFFLCFKYFPVKMKQNRRYFFSHFFQVVAFAVIKVAEQACYLCNVILFKIFYERKLREIA